MKLAVKTGLLASMIALAAPMSAQDGQGLFAAGDIAVTAARAEQGNAEAQHVLGLSYLYGQGMPKDEQRAFEWIRKAAEQGYSPAEVDLGHLYVQGRGTGCLQLGRFPRERVSQLLINGIIGNWVSAESASFRKAGWSQGVDATLACSLSAGV